ncbi:MAG: MerR family transcriptional regulator [Alphaproteobacteria bacterium]
MTRGELARLTGCTIEKVLYYEKTGLLPEPPRAANGYRIYDDIHVRQMRFVIRLRDLGFTIDEVRAMLVLVESGDYSCDEIRERTTVHLKSVRKKIDDLKKLEETLAETIAECHGGDTPDCPVIDSLLG